MLRDNVLQERPLGLALELSHAKHPPARLAKQMLPARSKTNETTISLHTAHATYVYVSGEETYI